MDQKDLDPSTPPPYQDAGSQKEDNVDTNHGSTGRTSRTSHEDGATAAVSTEHAPTTKQHLTLSFNKPSTEALKLKRPTPQSSISISTAVKDFFWSDKKKLDQNPPATTLSPTQSGATDDNTNYTRKRTHSGYTSSNNDEDRQYNLQYTPTREQQHSLGRISEEEQRKWRDELFVGSLTNDNRDDNVLFNTVVYVSNLLRVSNQQPAEGPVKYLLTRIQADQLIYAHETEHAIRELRDKQRMTITETLKKIANNHFDASEQNISPKEMVHKNNALLIHQQHAILREHIFSAILHNMQSENAISYEGAFQAVDEDSYQRLLWYIDITGLIQKEMKTFEAYGYRIPKFFSTFQPDCDIRSEKPSLNVLSYCSDADSPPAARKHMDQTRFNIQQPSAPPLNLKDDVLLYPPPRQHSNPTRSNAVYDADSKDRDVFKSNWSNAHRGYDIKNDPDPTVGRGNLPPTDSYKAPPPIYKVDYESDDSVQFDEMEKQGKCSILMSGRAPPADGTHRASRRLDIDEEPKSDMDKLAQVLKRICIHDKGEVLPFHGERSKWLEWYMNFIEGVDQNQNLTNREKLTKLKKALKGEAKRLADKIPQSDDQYNQILHKLRKTYGRPDEMIESVRWKLCNHVDVPINDLAAMESYTSLIGEYIHVAEKLSPDLLDNTMHIYNDIIGKLAATIIVEWQKYWRFKRRNLDYKQYSKCILYRFHRFMKRYTEDLAESIRLRRKPDQQIYENRKGNNYKNQSKQRSFQQNSQSRGRQGRSNSTNGRNYNNYNGNNDRYRSQSRQKDYNNGQQRSRSGSRSQTRNYQIFATNTTSPNNYATPARDDRGKHQPRRTMPRGRRNSTEGRGILTNKPTHTYNTRNRSRSNSQKRVHFNGNQSDSENAARSQQARSQHSNDQQHSRREPPNEGQAAVDTRGPARSAMKGVPSEHPCIFCKDNRHASRFCKDKETMTPMKKAYKIKEEQRCFLCCAKGHTGKFCHLDETCRIGNCGKKHCMHIHGLKWEDNKWRKE